MRPNPLVSLISKHIHDMLLLLWSVPSTEHTIVRQAAASLYLMNPCLVLSTAAGSAATLTNLSVLTALYGALGGNPALAALGIAVAAYLSAHPLLLLVSRQ